MTEVINSEEINKVKLSGVTEFDQMNAIIKVLGDPDEDDLSFMSEAKRNAFIKTYDNFAGKNFSTIFPSENDEWIHLIQKMLEFNPYNRYNVDECLNHPYFSEVRNVLNETMWSSSQIIDSTLSLSKSIFL